MRHVRLTLLMTILIVVSSTAFAGTPIYRGNRGDCRRMTKQINHYEHTVLVMAKARHDRHWEAATNNQLDRLKNRRADRCPDYRRQRSMLIAAKAQADRAKAIVAAGAKAAAKYFSGGWF